MIIFRKKMKKVDIEFFSVCLDFRTDSDAINTNQGSNYLAQKFWCVVWDNSIEKRKKGSLYSCVIRKLIGKKEKQRLLVMLRLIEWLDPRFWA